MEQWAGVVLAAGYGTRMKSKVSKVLHRVCGKELVRYPVDLLRHLGIERVVVVVSPTNGGAVQEVLGDEIEYVTQPEVLEENPYVQRQIIPLRRLRLQNIIEGEHQVNDEVSTLPAPGHTPGHQVVLVRSGGQKAMIVVQYRLAAYEQEAKKRQAAAGGATPGKASASPNVGGRVAAGRDGGEQMQHTHSLQSGQSTARTAPTTAAGAPVTIDRLESPSLLGSKMTPARSKLRDSS